MTQFSLLKAELLGFFVDALLFGAHSILYSISVWILIYRHRRRPTSPGLWMFAIVTFMWALACVYLCLVASHTIVAFVDHVDKPGGPLTYFEHEGNVPSYMVGPVLFALLTLVGDCFMTYRIYVIWRRELTSLVIPTLLIVGGLVSAACTGQALYRSPGSLPSGLKAPAVYKPLIAYFVMTLVTNIVTTLLLLARILYYDREARSIFHSQTRASSVRWKVMKTVIQSEAIYSIAILVNLVLYAIGSNAVYITFAALPPLVGISFTMIIARIGLSEVLDDTKDGDTQPGDLSTFRARNQTSVTTGRGSTQIGVLISPTVDWRNEEVGPTVGGNLHKPKDALPEGGVIHLHPLRSHSATT
ncbi:hypothetical protein GY45DRAFT_1435787 [Cubamyces sp. BRFM 1775]|nr:hypothetical protein GY45DRAFT_1435787 [Cubamyces sp. BRFM 1775]